MGGEPIEFNTIATCDGIAQGHSGMRYCLPHRDLITDSCEAMIVGGVFDGVVYMGSCDKIIPWMLNAAVRLNLPSALITAGLCYDVMTQAAIDNAVRPLASIGGSFNALIHLSALVAELGLKCTWAWWLKLRARRPLSATLFPMATSAASTCIRLAAFPQ